MYCVPCNWHMYIAMRNISVSMDLSLKLHYEEYVI